MYVRRRICRWGTGSGGAERSEARRGTFFFGVVQSAILMSRVSFTSTLFSAPRMVLHPSDEKLAIFWMSNPKSSSTPWIACTMSPAVLLVIVTNPRNFCRFVEAALRYMISWFSTPTSVVSSTVRPQHFTLLRSPWWLPLGPPQRSATILTRSSWNTTTWTLGLHYCGKDGLPGLLWCLKSSVDEGHEEFVLFNLRNCRTSLALCCEAVHGIVDTRLVTMVELVLSYSRTYDIRATWIHHFACTEQWSEVKCVYPTRHKSWWGQQGQKISLVSDKFVYLDIRPVVFITW